MQSDGAILLFTTAAPRDAKSIAKWNYLKDSRKDHLASCSTYAF